MDIDGLIFALKHYPIESLRIIGLLWLIHLFNYLVGYRLNVFGVVPRRSFGLIGVVFAPVLHGNFNHLFFNSIPLWALMTMCMMITPGLSAFLGISLCMVVLSGLLIWIFARPGIHIGASALITAYFGFLCVNGYFAPTIINSVLLLLCLFYFGGLVFSLFPGEKGVSWEGHTLGFIAGIVSYYLMPYVVGLL